MLGEAGGDMGEMVLDRGHRQARGRSRRAARRIVRMQVADGAARANAVQPGYIGAGTIIRIARRDGIEIAEMLARHDAAARGQRHRRLEMAAEGHDAVAHAPGPPSTGIGAGA